MKIIGTLIILILTFSCYNMDSEKSVNDKNIKTDSSQKEREDTTSINHSRPVLPPPIPPPKETIKNGGGIIGADENKIEEELNELEKSIRRMVQESIKNSKPSFILDVFEAQHQEQLKHFMDLKCEKTRTHLVAKFTFDQTKNYPKSSEKTGQSDGQSFCWYDLLETGNNKVKIIYSRNEGGHFSDQIQLVSIKEKKKEIYTLPLFSWFGRDGYEIKIESEIIDSKKIKRKIIERLGWKKEDDTDGSQQPRSETAQVFKILDTGEIELIQEQTKNFNFEQYMN